MAETSGSNHTTWEAVGSAIAAAALAVAAFLRRWRAAREKKTWAREPLRLPRSLARPPREVRALVVDDQELFRVAFRLLLQAHQINVVGEAADGAEAVALCEALLPDVVLLDLMMPGIDGVDAIRQIRAKCPEVKIIVVAGSRDRMIEAVQAGADDFVGKEMGPEIVVGRLIRLLDRTGQGT